MNIERLKELKDELLTAHRIRATFSMDDFYITPTGFMPLVTVSQAKTGIEHDCGTSCCIGGIVALLWGDPDDRMDGNTAARLLDITHDEASYLFFSWLSGFERDRSVAAKRVQNIIDGTWKDDLSNQH